MRRSARAAETPLQDHPRTVGSLGVWALAMGGSNQSLFLIGALMLSQGTAAVPLLVIGLLLAWAATPGWIELVLMWPKRVGGIAATCSEAFRPYSPVLSNLTGVCYWWGWVPTCGLTAILSASALHHWYLPFVSIPVLAVAIVLVFTVVNLMGIRTTTRVAMPIAFVAGGLAFLSGVVPVFAGGVDWHRAADFSLTTPFDGAFGALTSAMAGLYLIGFAAPAFEAATCHVGEMRDPVRSLPRAVYTSAATASLFFVVLPVVWLGVLGAGPIGGDLVTALGPTFAPLLGSAAKAAAIWFMVLNMFHGTLQPLCGASRTLSQLADDGLLPRLLGRRTRRDVPWAATFLTAGMSIFFLLFFLLAGDPVWVLAAANFTYLIAIAMPSVAVWLLRRNAPERERPYRAPRGTIVLGLGAAGVWGLSTVLGFQQFGLPTVLFGLGLAYAGSALYAWRAWSDRRRAGVPRLHSSLHVKLTGAMLLVMVLDGAGYLLAISHVDSGEKVLVTVLADIFVAVAILTVAVGLVLPGMIAHATQQVREAAERLARGTVADLTRAMEALGRGDLDAAHARVDLTPVHVSSRDEVGAMAESFNEMQGEVGRAAVALDGARDGLRTAESALERNVAQQAAAARLGHSALESRDLGELLRKITRTLRDVLGVRGAGLLTYGDGGEPLLLTGGEQDPLDARLRTPVTTGAHPAIIQEPLIVEDWSAEGRGLGSAPLRALGGESGVSIPVSEGESVFGALCAYESTARHFRPDEVDFVRTLANVLARAIARSRTEEEIRHKALHDPLTGLPNRNLFVDRLDHALATCERRGSTVAVLFLDLDQFKLVNDSLGHGAGDQLLQDVGARLASSLREGDTVARFGGDEFLIICEDLRDVAEALTLAERTAAALATPFVLNGIEHVVRGSIGIAVAEGERRASEDLVREADAAMYRAKELGRGRFEVYDDVMRARATDRLLIENELRRALSEGELRVHYQPIVSLTTGRVVGMEALARWQHPERGLLGPSEFITVAEENGTIVEIGTWILDEACRQAAAWHAARPDAEPIAMSVNLSLRQVAHSDLPLVVGAALRTSGLDPRLLNLEITESVLMDDPEAVMQTLARLRDLGVRLVLDDFGTGYSSLAYVKRFPIEVLKVDRSFIADLAREGHDSTIVEAVINMARGLRIEVVAEGVETEEQATALRDLGCELAQGYLYSRPVQAALAAKLLDVTFAPGAPAKAPVG